MGGDASERLPGWVTLLRAPNPGPMTLDGTNTWVLRAPGSAGAVVIDPGPLDDGHLRRIAGHGPFDSILVTHGHHDHVEGAGRLAELTSGTPVLAAAREHGAPFGDGPLRLGGLEIEVLGTPGHTGDSVCFLVDGVVFTGDTLLGRGTTVVAHPDGDLGAYLASLDVLSAYDGMVMLPGHGPARDDCGAVARAYRAHREQRLAQVRAAVEAGAGTAEAIVDAVYPGIEPGVRFAAAWSAQAQLDYLRRESPARSARLDPL